jgi:proteasome accessory factor B
MKLARKDAARQKLGKEGDFDIPEGFDIRRWSRQQIWDYDVAAPTPATVRFRGPLAGIAQHLLPGASLTSDGEGGRVARLDVRNLRGLVRQALAWGPDAEVTSPPEARAMAREILASSVSTLQGGTP